MERGYGLRCFQQNTALRKHDDRRHFWCKVSITTCASDVPRTITLARTAAAFAVALLMALASTTDAADQRTVRLAALCVLEAAAGFASRK